ncbi:ZDH23 Palmitoyltransferase, partial [Amia calva]|nr:ZDH23 Palmitoyltransferase [Amia calva]
MKRKGGQPAGEDESLCCCEYVDRQGEKSHLLACCCDCAELDQACDRWLKRESLDPGSVSRVAETVSDRLRVPWLSGARRVDLTVLPPLVLLPVLLHVAALHFLLGLVVLATLPALVLWYYYVTHRKKGRTLFFLSLGLFSLVYMYYLFLTEVVPKGDVGLLQLAAITVGLVLTLAALAQTKKDPGYLRSQPPPPPAGAHSTVTYPPERAGPSGVPNGARHEVLFLNGASHSELGRASGDQERVKKNWCPACRVVRPPRAGHCRICAACVQRLDHHCVWINSCVGQANHRCFLLTLLLFLLTALYGISLTLGSVCPRQSVLIALLYCPGVYQHYSSALCFTCAWYCSIVTGGLLHLFVLQLINVSYNVTEREARLALREKTGRRRLWGMIVDTGIYTRGFRKNWVDFLSMGGLGPLPQRLTDLV